MPNAMNPIDFDKIAKKSQFKLRGVVCDISTQKGKFVEICLQKGTKDKKKFYVFQCGGKIADRVRHLALGSRLKVWFTIKSSQWNGKWFTNLELQDFTQWIVNEDKLNKEKALRLKKEERTYSQAIHTSYKHI
jgi:hypothetical protein